MTKAERLADLALDMQQTVSPNTLALGYLRYEALRKLNMVGFWDLCHRNTDHGENFDDMVDSLILGGLTPPGKEVG